MSRDLDEDMIEATIRRVAASKAARLPDLPADEDDGDIAAAPGVANLHIVPPTGGDLSPEPTAEFTRAPVDESLIEATLRRIKAQQTARAAEDAPLIAQSESPDPSSNGAGQPDLHVVSPTYQAEPESASTLGAHRTQVDESLIEATLRRLESEQAALSIDETASNGTGAPNAPAGVSLVPLDALEPIAFPTREDSWIDATRELRHDLDETRQQLASLTAHVEAMLAGQIPLQQAPGPRNDAPVPPPPARDEDDWDDAPQLSRIPIGTPPRPAIVRDAPARTASESRPVDTAPQPLPRLEAPPAVEPEAVAPDAKRGFDLLPRTYRITVEDKRRGVDLVPLHRALLGMDGVRDMSLLSYSNGTAIVALETTIDIDPDVLGNAVSRAMAREVKVEVHNEQTMVIKLAED